MATITETAARVMRSIGWTCRRHYRTALAIWSSAVLVATTALVALVVEDWLPNNPSEPNKHLNFTASTPTRLAVAATAVLLLAGLAWLITRSRGVNGTLYHLRLLSDRAPDFHQVATARARDRSLSYRSVTRTLSMTSDPGNPVLDLTAVVAAARTELERAANTDDTTSAYEFAPNAHWPITFALATDWPLPEVTTLLEFEQDHDHPVLTVPATLPVPEALTPIPIQTPDPDIRLVHLDIHFSIKALITPTNRERAIRELFGAPAEVTHLWGVPAHSRQARAWTAPHDGRVPVRVTHDGLTPTIAAQATARAILQALDRYPDAHIAVTTRLPKIVVALAGRYFAAHLQRRLPERPTTGDTTPEMQQWRKQARRHRHWNDPWRRLTLLNFDEATQRMQILRVHPRQPQRAPHHRLTGPLNGTLINLTPHDLRVYDHNDTLLLTLPSTGTPARVPETHGPTVTFDATEGRIPVRELGYRHTPDPLPPQREGTWLIVSRIAAHTWTHRSDLLFPVDEVRDPQHRIIGCRGLAQLIPPGAQP
ncbi:hypothetical protein [Nocardia abscessus]|uniref:hypothetical protein n=1 Tax=Nocardia abscessus TaxID=120957 RepID=UPI0024571E3D|nr:hypothetical protein [Nocardia abscessus]